MKKIILISIFLAGCSALPVAFDSTEYDMFATLNVIATETKPHCSVPTQVRDAIGTMSFLSSKLVIYTKHKANNVDAAVLAAETNSMIKEIQMRYNNETPSVGYCKEKLDNVAEATERALMAIGREQK